MQKPNVDILRHFYGLLMEMDFHEPDEFIEEGNDISSDNFIQKHLRKIRLQSTKYKALREKSILQRLLEEIQKLKEIGFEKVNQCLNQKEAAQLQPLFSKFEDLSDKDQRSIAEDQELLMLLSAIKDRLNDEQCNK